MGKGDIYGINGFFVESGRTNLFGGYFFLPDLNHGTKSFKGKLVDVYGESGVTGEMVGAQELNFIKKYISRSEVNKYKFKKNKEGIWIGQYEGLNYLGRGYVVAKINLVWENLEMIALRDFSDGPLLSE